MPVRKEAQIYLESHHLENTMQFLRVSSKGKYLFGTIDENGNEHVKKSVKLSTIQVAVEKSDPANFMDSVKKLKSCLKSFRSKIEQKLPSSVRQYFSYDVVDHKSHFVVYLYLTNKDWLFNSTIKVVNIPKNLLASEVPKRFKKLKISIKDGLVDQINSSIYKLRKDEDEQLNALKKYWKYLDGNNDFHVKELLKQHQYVRQFYIVDNQVEIESVFCGKRIIISIEQFTEDVVLEMCGPYFEKKLAPYFLIIKHIKAIRECIDYLQDVQVPYKGIAIKRYAAGPKIQLSYTFGDQHFKTLINFLKPYRRELKKEIAATKKEAEEKAKAHKKVIQSNEHYGDLLDCEIIALAKMAHDQNKDVTENSAVKILRGLTLQTDWYETVENSFAQHLKGKNFSMIPSDTVEACFNRLETDGLLKSRAKQGTYGRFYVFRPTELGLDVLKASKGETDPKKSQYALMKNIKKIPYAEPSDYVTTIKMMIDCPSLFCMCNDSANMIIKRHSERFKSYLNVMAQLYKDDPDRKKIINAMKKMCK